MSSLEREEYKGYDYRGSVPTSRKRLSTPAFLRLFKHLNAIPSFVAMLDNIMLEVVTILQNHGNRGAGRTYVRKHIVGYIDEHYDGVIPMLGIKTGVRDAFSPLSYVAGCVLNAYVSWDFKPKRNTQLIPNDMADAWKIGAMASIYGAQVTPTSCLEKWYQPLITGRPGGKQNYQFLKSWECERVGPMHWDKDDLRTMFLPGDYHIGIDPAMDIDTTALHWDLTNYVTIQDSIVENPFREGEEDMNYKVPELIAKLKEQRKDIENEVSRVQTMALAKLTDSIEPRMNVFLPPVQVEAGTPPALKVAFPIDADALLEKIDTLIVQLEMAAEPTVELKGITQYLRSPRVIVRELHKAEITIS